MSICLVELEMSQCEQPAIWLSTMTRALLGDAATPAILVIWRHLQCKMPLSSYSGQIDAWHVLKQPHVGSQIDQLCISISMTVEFDLEPILTLVLCQMGLQEHLSIALGLLCSVSVEN